MLTFFCLCFFVDTVYRKQQTLDVVMLRLLIHFILNFLLVHTILLLYY